MTAPPSTETPRHTATPWRVTRKYEVGPVSTADDQTYGMVIPVADVFGDNREADAALIVTAVNSHASLTARVAELEADLVRLSAVWIVETQRVEKLETALGLARNRIEYLGVACINPRHHQANCDEFLPRIDAALDNADGGRGS